MPQIDINRKIITKVEVHRPKLHVGLRPMLLKTFSRLAGSIEPILQCLAEALGMCKTGDWEKPTDP